MKFKKIIIYDEPSVSEINIHHLVNFLKEILPVDVVIKENFFKAFSTQQIQKVSESRIFQINKKFQYHKPSQNDLEFEKKICNDSKIMEQTKKPENATNINQVVMYDGFEMQKIIRENLNHQDNTILHIILTNRFTCTYDESDNRYHGRAVICANPAIISTTGMIEAPAKSREFYIEVMKSKMQGQDIKSVKEKYKGDFLDYHDKRLSKIIEGYLLQVVFYMLTGEPFCDYLDCRLNNAHWQKDLLYSQIKNRKLCHTHQEILNSQI